MIILDTDVWTLQQQGAGASFDSLAARLLQATDRDVRVSVVSVQEQLQGWLTHLSKANDVDRLVRGYERLREWVVKAGASPTVGYDERSASEFAKLRRSGTRIGTMDLRIAAIAIANDALLISRNLRDFERVPGLRVEDWTR